MTRVAVVLRLPAGFPLLTVDCYATQFPATLYVFAVTPSVLSVSGCNTWTFAFRSIWSPVWIFFTAYNPPYRCKVLGLILIHHKLGIIVVPFCPYIIRFFVRTNISPLLLFVYRKNHNTNHQIYILHQPLPSSLVPFPLQVLKFHLICHMLTIFCYIINSNITIFFKVSLPVACSSYIQSPYFRWYIWITSVLLLSLKHSSILQNDILHSLLQSSLEQRLSPVRDFHSFYLHVLPPMLHN